MQIIELIYEDANDKDRKVQKWIKIIVNIILQYIIYM